VGALNQSDRDDAPLKFFSLPFSYGLSTAIAPRRVLLRRVIPACTPPRDSHSPRFNGTLFLVARIASAPVVDPELAHFTRRTRALMFWEAYRPSPSFYTPSGFFRFFTIQGMSEFFVFCSCREGERLILSYAQSFCYASPPGLNFSILWACRWRLGISCP